MHQRNPGSFLRSTSQSALSTAPISRLRLCFETMSDGRIPVVNDFEYVVRCLALFPSVYVQAEHVYGRLSMSMPRTELIQNFTMPLETSALANGSEVKPIQAHSIWATLKECSCCGSPGQISFYNCFDERFLQISASPDTELRDWALFLAQVSVTPKTQLDGADEAKFEEYPHPVVPVEAEEIKLSKFRFIELLNKMAMSEAVFEFSLPTYEFSLKKAFSIYQIYEEEGQLTCRGKEVGFTLSLAAVKEYAVKVEYGVRTLYCLAVEQKVIFEISVPDSFESSEIWNRVLAEVQHLDI